MTDGAAVGDQGRLSGADGLRGVAMLIVLTTHAVILNNSEMYVILKGIPKIGVWLFFSLSAYLLTYRLLAERVSANAGVVLLRYALARFLRIIPLYVLAVLLYYRFGGAGISATSDLADALLLQKGFAHL